MREAWDRLIFLSEYGEVYGIRKNDSTTDLRTERERPSTRKPKHKKQAEKPKTALERAKEKI